MSERKSFSSYKNSRDRKVETLLEKTESFKSGKKDYTDDRLYKYKADNAGNVFVIGRFLPSPNELLPIIKRMRHFFEVKKGMWVIENCPTTLTKDCPICEDNKRWYDKDSEDYQTLGQSRCKEIGGKRSRNKEYYANWYVIKDSAQPENEGKVFIYKFGEKVKDKIFAKLQPSEEEQAAGVKPLQVFDLFEGANFKLKLKRKDGQMNYDDCEFLPPTPLFEGDDSESKMEAVFDELYELDEFCDVKTFKSYDVLKKILEDKLSGKTPSKSKIEEDIKDEEGVNLVDDDSKEEVKEEVKEEQDAVPADKQEQYEKVKEEVKEEPKTETPKEEVKEEVKKEAGGVDDYFNNL